MQVLFQSVPSLGLFNNYWVFRHTCWNFLNTGIIACLFPAFNGGDGLSHYHDNFLKLGNYVQKEIVTSIDCLN